MTRTLLTFLLALPLFALDNSFTLANWNGVGAGATRGTASTLQTARPITLHRVFAQGEITGFPQPRVDGVAATTWQADVHSRYRDASVARSCSAVGQNAAGAIQITCNGHAFQNLENVTIAGIPGLNGAHTVYEPTTNTFLIRGTYAGPYTPVGATATGPTFGSVKAAHISLKSDIAANGSIVVDFVNNANPCSSGNRAACDAASLNQAGMLSFSSWNFKIDTIANAVTKSGDARTMLTAGDFSYWMRGPVVTAILVENTSSADPWSFGWHLIGGVMTVDGGPQYRSLLPRFVLTFYPGWPGVKGDVILENTWTNRQQDQIYALSIKTGAAPSEVYSKAAFKHFTRTRWRKTFWDGTVPGDVKMDYNFKYLVYAKALMPYDTTIVADPVGAPTNWYATYLASGKGEIMDRAYNTADMFEGEEEAGILQGMDVNYLATGSPQLHDTMFGTRLSDSAAAYVSGGGGMAATASHNQQFIRSDTSSLNYCRYTCPGGANVQTYGRQHSIEANPYSRTTNNWNVGTSVGDASYNGWGFSATHMWNLSYAPWLITGDPYYAEDLFTWANALSMHPNTEDGEYMRHMYWAYFNEHGFEVRGSAWAIAMMASAAFAQPDGAPEKALMARFVETQFAVMEGQFGITDGLFGPGYPCSTAAYAPTFNSVSWTMSGYTSANGDWCNRWYWGLSRVYSKKEDGGPDQSAVLLRNPLHLMARGGYYQSMPRERQNSAYSWTSDGMFQFLYKYTSMTRVKLFGFVAADRVLNETAKFFLNVARHPNGNPFLWTEYRIPLRKRANAPVPITAYVLGATQTITAAGHGLSVGSGFAICCSAPINQPVGDSPFNPAHQGYTVTSVIDANTFTITTGFLLGNDIDATATGFRWKALAGSQLQEGFTFTDYQIDNEQVHCDSYAGGMFYNCRRGLNGTVAAPHALDAGVFPAAAPFVPGNAWINSSGFGGPFQTLADWRKGFLFPTNNAMYGGPSDVTDGYTHYATAVSALLAGYSDTSTMEGWSKPRTGEATWDWFHGNATHQNLYPGILKWVFRPNQIRNVKLTPAATSVVLRWDDVDGGASTVAVSATPFSVSSDAGDTVVAAGKRRKTATITGLSGGAIYYYRITHGADRVMGTFVTN